MQRRLRQSFNDKPDTSCKSKTEMLRPTVYPLRYISDAEPNDAGFTLVEVLTAMALMGTLMLVVWSASSNAVGSVRSTEQKIVANIEILRIDRAVRGYLQRVDTPYWLAAPKVESVAQGLRLYGLDGDSSRYVQLQFKRSVLSVGAAKSGVSFRGIKTASMQVRSATQKSASVFVLNLEMQEGERVSIVAQFGAHPFPILSQS